MKSSSKYRVVEHKWADGKLSKRNVGAVTNKSTAQAQADKLNEAQATKEVENLNPSPDAPITSYIVQEA